MKKNFAKVIGSTVLLLTIGFQSCDNGFEDLNKNPDAVSNVTPEYIFTKAQLDAINVPAAAFLYSSSVVGAGGFVQHFATYKDVPSLGDRYTWSQGGYPYALFNTSYQYAVNEIGEVIRAVQDDAELVNKHSAARVWRVFIMHRITDLYGDIPYSEAGKAYSEKIFTPKYDTQEEIYANMLTELEQAAAAFDNTKATFGNSDLIYGGDVTKWKKFAYSLMLKLGMRLTKVDVADAELWVKKAITGGVMTEDADLAKLIYSDGQDFNRNPVAFDLLSNDYGSANGTANKEGGKLAKTFIDYLKAENDPRLGAIAVAWSGGVADTAASVQKGMPNGLVGGGAPGDFGTYSEPNPKTVLKPSAPYLLLTNAEVNLLLAEASVRGWYAGDAATAFSDAMKASMRQWALYDAAGVIAGAKIDAYAAAHALTGTVDEKMEQIHTEFWVALFPNELEIFANWRRTGYPALTPLNVPGNLTNGTIPRRLIYPPSEESLNGVNYQDAVSRITGGNVFTGRVWWDKQ